MKKIISLIVLCFVTCSPYTFAQQSFMSGENVAVFYPADFDSSGTLPSLIFRESVEHSGSVSPDWEITPEFEMVDGKAVAKITYLDNVDLYGTGEVTGPLRRNGTEVVLWNTDNYGYSKGDGKRLYQSHPWIMGVRPDGSSFGIIADNTWKQTINLSNPITITSEGPAFRVIVIERENPQELMKALGSLTGTMELPPLWTLGYQQSRYSYYPDSAVKNLADEFRERKIPADVIWMDIDYMQDFKIFTFDSTGFPNPKEVNDHLHSQNFKAIWMIDPGVAKEDGYHIYESGTAGNHWVLTEDGEPFVGEVWPGACVFPDFTRPDTRNWWQGLYTDFMATGIDGVWNDMNEPAVFDGPDGTMPVTNIHRGGGELPSGPHLRYHNVYGLLMVKASREGIRKINPDKRPFVLSRANFLGGQQYAATWTGDNKSSWEDFEMSIPMSITLGLSGQPFNGPDIGGFVGSPDAELLANWMAIGAFYPFSRNHTAKDTEQQEPWAKAELVETVSRNALERRYRLMPYIYTLFREASVSGMPIMRPVFFADATDLSLREEDEAFMLGEDLLIVPKWAESPALPEGKWRDIKVLDQPLQHEEYQPELRIRDGAILPIGNLIQNTTEFNTDSLTLAVSLNEEGMANGILYTDAGDGFGYQDGEFAELHFSADQDEEGVIIHVRQTDGDLPKIEAITYKIMLYTDEEIIETNWQQGADLRVELNPVLQE